LVEAAAAGQLPLAGAYSMLFGLGGYDGCGDDMNAAFKTLQEVAAAGGAAWIVGEAEAMFGSCYAIGKGVAKDNASSPNVRHHRAIRL
jgi:hypothetical protein